MEAIVAIAALTAFGYFVFTRIRKSRASKGTGSGGGGGRDTGRDTKLK